MGTLFRFVVVAGILATLGAGIVTGHGTVWMRANLLALVVSFVVGAAAMGLVVRATATPSAAGHGRVVIGDGARLRVRDLRAIHGTVLDKCPGCGETGRYLAREHAVVCRECGLMHL
jgi:hypothetical protein